ncbi:MAG: hypothetical protein JNM69_03985 [Archangium sp.]|nr:hypothetical protein [Archangium sp.]
MRPHRVIAPALLLLACDVPPEVVSDDLTDLPLAGLSDDWRARFDEGDHLFEVPFTERDGLGPLFIRPSCAACHEGGGKGPGFVEKLAQVEADGVTPVPGQPQLILGHTVRRMTTAGATVPLDGAGLARLARSTRVGQSVWAAGAIEAIDEAELERLERAQAAGADGVSGRRNVVVYTSERSADLSFHQHRKGDSVVGRFGVKARVATLDDFAADAFQGDMGLTSPLRPTEPQNPEGLTDDSKPGVDLPLEMVASVADYLRLLRFPARRTPPSRAATLFETTGCAVCHVPSLRTRADYPVAARAGTTVAVYTDVLLHDMGPTLADGLTDGSATSSEFRTSPLVGLRFLKSFLHDGRATSLDEAVRLHGGPGSEARASVLHYEQLSDVERTTLLTFLESL